MLFFCMTANAEAAWKKNSNGTYSYYSNGVLLKSKWINGTYYVNSQGIRQTGWMYKGGKWYYFSKTTGKVVKSKWIRSGKNMYFAGSNGALYTDGRYKIGSYYYAFNARGVRLTGKRTIDGKTYYFSTKNGQMQTKKWCVTSKVYYYYGSNGVMAKNKWVGRYYVGKTGKRLTNQWKDNRYLSSTGKCVSGLKKIDGVYYYFDTSTYRKVTDTTITVKDVTYQFDSDGRGTIVTNSIPTAKVSVEQEYYTDPAVDDTTLLSAIIYCEAGNQPYAGKVAVGLVIMNRRNSALFPDTIREIIYQSHQFTPAYSGVMTKVLNNQSLITSECKKAAKEIMTKLGSYQSGQKVKLELNDEQIDFPYLFFMTKAAYNGCGLSAPYIQIGGHVFFEKWR